nr:uncharacterized protein LOC113698283 [Coffea arabica]XP_027073852.1 uncharacterized protein LOC113698283 [Coffea arabica]
MEEDILTEHRHGAKSPAHAPVKPPLPSPKKAPVYPPKKAPAYPPKKAPTYPQRWLQFIRPRRLLHTLPKFLQFTPRLSKTMVTVSNCAWNTARRRSRKGDA